MLAAARDALVEGWRLSMWFGVALAGAALAFLVLRGPKGSPALDAAETETEFVLAG